MPIGVRYGLSLDEFYRLNPKKLERYQPFLMERLKKAKDQDSEVGWINGQYVARAVSAVLPKGKRYPETPIRFYGLPEDEEGNVITDADRFAAWATMFNKANEGKFKDKDADASGESADADISVANTDRNDTNTEESQ